MGTMRVIFSRRLGVGENNRLFTADNSEAIDQAKDWTASLNSIAKDAWLQIDLNGVAIRSLRPGEL
jgi:hypothetical protein